MLIEEGKIGSVKYTAISAWGTVILGGACAMDLALFLGLKSRWVPLAWLICIFPFWWLRSLSIGRASERWVSLVLAGLE